MASAIHRLSLPSGVKAGGRFLVLGFAAPSFACTTVSHPFDSVFGWFKGELTLFKIALRETLEEKGV
jgi:hypothetical protein